MKAALLALCQLLPDLIFRRTNLFMDAQMLRKHIVLLGVICVLFAAGGLNFASIIAVGLLFFLNAAWHVCIAYFGVLLRSEDFILLSKPDHFQDVAAIVGTEAKRFRVLIAALAGSLVLSIVVIGLFSNLHAGSWATGLACVVIVIVGVRLKSQSNVKRSCMDIPCHCLDRLGAFMRWPLPLHGSCRR